jgi:molecular chaperone DnaK
MKDLGDKVPEETRSTIEAASAEVRTALEGEDNDAIKAASEKLQEASYKLAEIVYGNAQAENGGDSGEAATDEESHGDEEVADYEVVDDDSKK